MKNNILFISGTDTGVGKTYVSRCILRYLCEAGYRVAAIKPVETGFIEAENSDAELLRAAAGGWQSIEEVLYYHFPQAISPHLAANLVEVKISQQEIVSRIQATASEVDFVLVEGAGGLMVPYSVDFRFIDLIEVMNQATLLVVGSKLGAINHSLLSLEAMHHRNLPICGYVLNECEERAKTDMAKETNRSAIAAQVATDVAEEIAYFPYISDGFSQETTNSTELSAVIEKLGSHLIDYYKLTR